MGKQRVPKGQVFLKKEEKVLDVLRHLGPKNTDHEFVEKFQELYPNAWTKVVARWKIHEQLTPLGKSHPMPLPSQYVINVGQRFRKRYAEGESLESMQRSSSTAADAGESEVTGE